MKSLGKGLRGGKESRTHAENYKECQGQNSNVSQPGGNKQGQWDSLDGSAVRDYYFGSKVCFIAATITND